MVAEIRTRALSRHPIEITLVFSLAVASAFQLAQGPAQGTLSAMLSTTPRLVLSIVIILGAALTLVGAIFHPKIEPLALHAELAGVASIGFAMTAYLSLIVLEVPHWWLTSSVWTTGGIAIGFLWRGVQIIHLIRELISLTTRLNELESL